MDNARTPHLLLAALSMALVSCLSGPKTVAPGFPAVDGSGASFDLTVDGVSRHDEGFLGAYFVDDALVARQHYGIGATDTSLTVPSLTPGSYALPDANGNVGALYDNGGFYSARAMLQIVIVGNDGEYVWGSFNGLFTDSFSVEPQPAFPITAVFAAYIN